MAKQRITNEERVALYNKLIESHPEAERRGDTVPYTSLNGNMYSYVSKDGFMALRLEKEDREAFLQKYETKLVESYGVIQNEYVTVPDNLLKKLRELKAYFNKSYQYVKSLKSRNTIKALKKKKSVSDNNGI